MKVKLTLIFLTVFLMSLFLFPRFYFNQLVYKTQQVYSSVEEARSIANNDIEQRSGREGGIKSSEEVKILSVKITADLNNVGNLVNGHEFILNKQGKFVFLLPSKYKKFYDLEKEAFSKYYSSLKKFQALKEYESGMMEATFLQDQLSKLMLSSIKSPSENFDAIKKIITELKDSRNNIKKYFDEGFMTEEYYSGMFENISKNIELHSLFIEAYEKNYSPEELEKRIEETKSKYKQKDLLILFNDSFNKVTTAKQKEWGDSYDQADELLSGALDFYDQNRLAYDPLSIFLSKFNKNYPKNITLKDNTENKPENIKADLNGDGKEETLSLIVSENKDEGSPVSLVAYDENGKEIGRLPEEFPINNPFSDSAKVYTPIKKDKNQFVSYEFMAGPHSSETMFFGLFELQAGGKGILPVCLTLEVKGPRDCLFWSGNIGDLVADDFDGDGILEVVEMVDEYPKDGTITSEIEDTINKEFKDSDAAGGMIRIAKKEQGGRGNQVVWGIYRYNGEYFEEQLNANYEKYFKLIDPYFRRFYPDYPTIMRKSETSKDSLEYNEFMRNFWTHGEEQ